MQPRVSQFFCISYNVSILTFYPFQILSYWSQAIQDCQSRMTIQKFFKFFSEKLNDFPRTFFHLLLTADLRTWGINFKIHKY